MSVLNLYRQRRVKCTNMGKGVLEMDKAHLTSWGILGEW